MDLAWTMKRLEGQIHGASNLIPGSVVVARGRARTQRPMARRKEVRRVPFQFATDEHGPVRARPPFEGRTGCRKYHLVSVYHHWPWPRRNGHPAHLGDNRTLRRTLPPPHLYRRRNRLLPASAESGNPFCRALRRKGSGDEGAWHRSYPAGALARR